MIKKDENLEVWDTKYHKWIPTKALEDEDEDNFVTVNKNFYDCFDDYTYVVCSNSDKWRYQPEKYLPGMENMEAFNGGDKVIKVKKVDVVINATMEVRQDSNTDDIKNTDWFQEQMGDIKKHIKSSPYLQNVEIEDIN